MAAVALEGIGAEAALEDTVAEAQQGFGLVEADMDPVEGIGAVAALEDIEAALEGIEAEAALETDLEQEGIEAEGLGTGLVLAEDTSAAAALAMAKSLKKKGKSPA